MLKGGNIAHFGPTTMKFGGCYGNCKFLMFLWRACHNLMLTIVNLPKRGVIMEPSCPIGGIEAERTTHILWGCPSTMDVWVASRKKSKKLT
jgi:hypothetical protein